MIWEIVWTHQSTRDLDNLDRQIVRRMEDAVDHLALTGRGDVRRLKGPGEEWRLRVGEYRVRLEYDRQAGCIRVLRVLPRSSAY